MAVDFLLGNGQILFNITFEDDQQVLSVTLESMYHSTSIEFKKKEMSDLKEQAFTFQSIVSCEIYRFSTL